MPIGKGGQRMGEIRCDFLAAGATTKAPKESWEIVKWLTNKESAIRLGEGAAGQSGTSGSRPDALKSERLITNSMYRPEVHKNFIVAMDEGKTPIFRGLANFRGAEAEKTLVNALDPILLGTQQPTTAYLEGVSKSVQAIMDKPRP